MAPPIPVPLLSLHPLMLGRSSSLAASRASSIIVQKDLQLLHRGDLVVMYLLHWKGLFWVLVQKKKKWKNTTLLLSAPQEVLSASMAFMNWAGFCPKPPTGLQNSWEKQGKGAEQQQPHQPLETKGKVGEEGARGSACWH